MPSAAVTTSDPLNVLLSFAQFEREVTAERIRDKVAASTRKGIWMGGPPPFGYDVRERALVVNAEEAKSVQTNFETQLEPRSVPLLMRRLADLGITSKRRLSRTGRTSGGGAFSRGALYLLLRNGTYIGKTPHKGEMHEGQHAAIVARETWDRAQALLDEAGGRQSAPRRSARRTLDGRLHDSHGRPMRTTFAQRKTVSGTARIIKRYSYYASARADDTGAPPAERVPAEAVEIAVGDALRTQLCDRAWLADRLRQAGTGPRCDPRVVFKAALTRRQIRSRCVANRKTCREEGVR